MSPALERLRGRFAALKHGGTVGSALEQGGPVMLGSALEQGGAVARPFSRWSYEALAGRLVELSCGRAATGLTLAMGLVAGAQRAGEPVAWICDAGSGFYPPDAAANGVDLAALAVVRIPPPRPAQGRDPGTEPRPAQGSGPAEAPRPAQGRGPAIEWRAAPGAVQPHPAQGRGPAAERLARSGAFGLIVLDLGGRARLPAPLQARLAQQAQRHGTAIVCLTEKAPHAPSLGSLVSLRGHGRRRRKEAGRFACVLSVSKDKRAGPGWTHAEECHGVPGLR